MKTLFKNVKVLDLDNNCLFDAHVLVDGDKIAYIGDQTQPAHKVVEGNGNILMPGFVNAHAHNPMCVLKNTFDDCPLDQWLFDNILPKEQKLTPEDVFWAQSLGIAESVRNGITCIEECYFHQPSIYKAINLAGIRARIGLGKAINGQNLEKEILENFELCKDNPLVKNAVYAHSVYAYSPEELETSVGLANKLNLPVSIHLSETLKEVGDCDSQYGKSPVGLLEDVGYFDRSCLVYHAVHCDKDDMQILANYDVSVATCPASNLKLASGIAPICSYIEKGINVCIGTDGQASNNTLDMFKEMYLTSCLAKVYTGKADAISACDILKMATINGAKALGFENVGKVQVGYQADLILIDINQLSYLPHNDLISALVYCGKGSDVLLTMVAGKILYHEGRYRIGYDIEKIIKQTNLIAEKLKGN